MIIKKTVILIALIIFVNALFFTSASCVAEDTKFTAEIQSLINPCWWSKFNDSFLLDYVYKAAQHNQDLKISSLKVLESRQTINQYFGRELPQLFTQPTYLNTEPLNVGAQQKTDQRNNVVFAPFIASYEADIWQKNHQQTKQQKQLYENSKQAEKSSYITATTEVASAYFNILRYDKLIALQNLLIALDNQNTCIMEAKYKAGLAPLNDLSSAIKDLKEAKAQIVEFDKQRELFINQLYVLIGETPEQTRNLKRKSIDDEYFIKDLSLTIPSQKILDRPDIKQSENNIKIAKIDVSLARKSFLPDIPIYGVLSFNSQTAKNILNLNDLSKIFFAGVSEKLFTGGQRIASLKAKKYKYEEMLQTYQKNILTALKEVNDALVGLKNDMEINNNYLDKIMLENNNLNLVNTNYKNGLVSYQSTIKTQISLVQLQQQQIQAKANCFIDALNLYKALGGAL